MKRPTSGMADAPASRAGSFPGSSPGSGTMLWILAPHFVAGIEPGVRSAPILAWMLKRRWTKEQIIAYCKKKNWTVEEMP